MNQIRWLSVFGVLLLAGCGPSNSSKEEKLQSEAKQAAKKMLADLQLPSDQNTAIVEVIRRLRSRVKFRDGVIIVDDPRAFGLAVVSANSPWVINCGIGVTVIFGSSVSGGAGEEVDNDVKTTLALAPIEKVQCRELALAIGKEIQAILAGG